jgi:hypothetical protein
MLSTKVFDNKKMLSRRSLDKKTWIFDLKIKTDKTHIYILLKKIKIHFCYPARLWITFFCYPILFFVIQNCVG